MVYLAEYSINCPYCGETFQTSIDPSSGSQVYIEDCYVCCRPIQFNVEVDHLGEVTAVTALRDDE